MDVVGTSFIPLHSNQEQQRRDLKHKYVPRATQACGICKRKKIKCDEGRPTCSSCKKRGYTCAYAGVEYQAQNEDVVGDKVFQTNEYPRLLTSQTVHAFETHVSPKKRPAEGSRPSSSSSLGQETKRRTGPNDALHSQSVSHMSASPSMRHDETPSGLAPVEGTNEYTKGKEFYGTSSNFSLLNQLINKARSRMTVASATILDGYHNRDPASRRSLGQEEILARALEAIDGVDQRGKLLKDSRISLVNFLSDEDAAIHDSAPPSGTRTPVVSVNVQTIRSTGKVLHEPSLHSQSPDLNLTSEIKPDDYAGEADYHESKNNNSTAISLARSHWIEVHLEKEYIRIFFDNLHYIHPFLSHTAFIARCERDVWKDTNLQVARKRASHFLALYNAVTAVGALTAGKDVLETLRSTLGKQLSSKNPRSGSYIPTSIDYSKIYFARAKRALGDYFEVCSMEGVQALMLMSLYSQNALKPHACYMYSGMAVRSALAIGMSDECNPESMVECGEAKRTWWAVYSQEVDMCCSSGRRSSLVDPESYRLPLPLGKVDGSVSPIDMIPQMVLFAAILLRISLQLYHSPGNVSEHERSRIAFSLDAELSAWRSNLPSWLESGMHPFAEPEWAGKQRLVLQLRFYNAQILIHRPLIAISDAQSLDELQTHTAACLDGARKTIELLYEAYTHRHYFRTWYYNATYTLYASMLVLYVILIDYPRVPKNELIRDVEKSLEILHAMDNVKVARRCANLILEVLEVAKNQREISQPSSHGSSKRINLAADTMSSLEFQHQANTQAGARNHQSMDGNIDIARTDLLASLVDPVTLEGFASDTNTGQTMNFDCNWNAIDLDLWTDFDLSQDFLAED